MRAALTVVVVVGLGFAVAGRSQACSLPARTTPAEPRALVADADAAFIGTLLDIRLKDPPAPPSSPGVPVPVSLAGPYVFTYEVTERIKGDLSERVEVVAPSGASCGLDGPVGRRTGLLLRGGPGAWTAGLGDQVDPETLRRGARPLPEPTRAGTATFIAAGHFGTVRTALLDAGGRAIRYGAGRGAVTALAVCPGGRALVELVSRENDVVLAVRRLPTLELVSERRLLRSGAGESVFCRNRSGTVALATVRRYGAESRMQLIRVTPIGMQTLVRASELAVAMRGDQAFVSTPDGRLTVRNLRTGARRFLASTVLMLRQMSVSPDGSRLAGFTVADGLTLVDVGRGTVDTYSIAWSPRNTIGWLEGDRLAAAGAGSLQVFDRRLRPLRSPHPWLVHTTSIGSTGAFGVDWSGALLTVRGGSAERLGTLFSPAVTALVPL